MKKFVKAGIAGLIGFSPLLALAANANVSNDNIANLIAQVNAFINTIIPFIVGLAVLIVIWGVFNYVAGSGDGEKRAEAKQYIVWGVIGIFIMLSVWGLVNVLVNSFALRKGPLNSTQLPKFDTKGTIIEADDVSIPTN